MGFNTYGDEIRIKKVIVIPSNTKYAGQDLLSIYTDQNFRERNTYLFTNNVVGGLTEAIVNVNTTFRTGVTGLTLRYGKDMKIIIFCEICNF